MLPATKNLIKLGNRKNYQREQNKITHKSNTTLKLKQPNSQITNINFL